VHASVLSLFLWSKMQKAQSRRSIDKFTMAMFAGTDLSNLLSGVRVTQIGRERDVQAGYGSGVGSTLVSCGALKQA